MSDNRIVHVAYAPFPQDPRVRREALVAADLLPTTVVCLTDDHAPEGRDRWNNIDVVRIAGAKRRGTLAQYFAEYYGFVRDVYQLFRSDPQLRSASIVHIHSLPDFLVFAARPARRAGARIILDLHEIFPEFARVKYGSIGGRIAEPVARMLERLSRRFADVTITVNRPILALLAGRPARANEWLEIVHNVPDLRDFGPARKPRQTDNATTLLLVYHGTLTQMYGLDLAVDGVALARSLGHDVRLDIFGDGPQRDALATQIERLALNDAIRLRGVVSAKLLREELPRYDAGLVPTRADAMTKYSLSTKLLEYVHLGLPVIAPALATYQEYFPPPSLLYYAPDDASALGSAIAALFVAPAADRAAFACAAQAHLSTLTWESERVRLRALYESLLRMRA